MREYEALLEVRKLVDEKWAQGYKGQFPYGTMHGTGGYCLWTACYTVLKTNGHRAIDLVRLMGFVDAFEVWKWNDEDGRTKEQVLAVIDLALDNIVWSDEYVQAGLEAMERVLEGV